MIAYQSGEVARHGGAVLNCCLSLPFVYIFSFLFWVQFCRLESGVSSSLQAVSCDILLFTGVVAAMGSQVNRGISYGAVWGDGRTLFSSMQNETRNKNRNRKHEWKRRTTIQNSTIMQSCLPWSICDHNSILALTFYLSKWVTCR